MPLDEANQERKPIKFECGHESVHNLCECQTEKNGCYMCHLQKFHVRKVITSS